MFEQAVGGHLLEYPAHHGRAAADERGEILGWPRARTVAAHCRGDDVDDVEVIGLLFLAAAEVAVEGRAGDSERGGDFVG